LKGTKRRNVGKLNKKAKNTNVFYEIYWLCVCVVVQYISHLPSHILYCVVCIYQNP
jgi:hypothetical protein